MKPSEAKTAIRTVVDRTTAAVGGNWTVRSGPALSMCPGSADDRGVTYKLILDRDGAGDREADLAEVQKSWEAEGMTTRRYESRGEHPITSVIGRGGPTTSIQLLTREDGYSLTGVSECADGDFDKMVLENDF
ncbi:hypothetical protein [Curtobacterium sp. CFBP9011]|uniref:hypothetical protein n=1 Tax=Curtobacterium sp. CFBP9011 TaxID=3096530 RepID=UPI002A69C58D|nr:hypothetical protein [Curtobacterium sp. CFBP9011]MDY1004004.1 hypothetical protein [Curtobacterium sp. CFBP9011]